MKLRNFFLIVLIFVIPLFNSCKEDEFNVNNVESDKSNVNIGGDTLYIQIKPAWTGFNKPQAIIVGREPFIYVADTYNDRIVMLNLNGDVLGARTVKHPVAIAQDYKFNLIICGEFDTTYNGQTQTFGGVFKIDMVAASHHIDEAPMTRLLPHQSSDLKNPDRRYTGVAAFYNNTFYVARTGPNNSSFVDPDNSILFFSPKELAGGGEGDTLIGRVPNIDPISSGLVSAYGISSLTSFNQRNIDFIETLTGNNSLKTQWLTYVVTPLSSNYEARLTPANGGELMAPNKFGQPEGVCLDDANDIFVADAQKDSVFKFNALGDELQSFGGSSVFDQPYDVAYYNQILYVVDSGNNRILRFILSTDVQ